MKARLGKAAGIWLLLFLIVSGGTYAQTVSNLTAAADFGQIKLNWDRYTGGTVVSYTIHYKNSPGVTTSDPSFNTGTTNISYTHTGLTPGLTYYYIIIANISGGGNTLPGNEASAGVISMNNFFGGGNGDGFSSFKTCYSDLDGSVITLSPANLSVAASTSSNVLKWDGISDAINYTVRYSTDPGFGTYTDETGITNISWLHAPATPGTPYYYKVTCNVGGSCPTGYTATIASTPAPMSHLTGGQGDGHSASLACLHTLNGAAVVQSPTNLIVAASLNQNVMEWSAMSGATSYTVRWSTDPSFASFTDQTGITTISWAHSNTTAGTSYYYRITASTGGSCPVGFSNDASAIPVVQTHIAGGQGDGFSAFKSCDIDLDGNSITPGPSNLVVAASLYANTMSWDQMSGASSYTVRWSTDPAFASYTDQTGITNISWVHTNAAPGTPYYYKITASTGGGCPVGYSNSATAIAVVQTHITGGSGDGFSSYKSCDIDLGGNSITPGPTNLVVAASLYANAMSWDQMSGATSYTVRWSTDPAFASYTDQAGITDISWVHTNAAPGTTYYYRVTASTGGVCPVGFSNDGSATAVVQTHLTGGNGDGYDGWRSCMLNLDGSSVILTPTGLTVAASQISNVINWDQMTEATSYTLEWSTDPAFGSYTTVNNITNISWLHNGLTGGSAYYYRITGIVGGGCPSGFTTVSTSVPATADYLSGGQGDGFSSALSCFSITLDGIDPTVNPPGPLSLCTGQTQLLTSSSGITYQWFLNGSPISGETGQTYTAGQGGDFKVRITTAIGCSAFSMPVSISFGGPTVNAQPADASTCDGLTASFYFDVNGSGLNYQWYESPDGISWTALSNTAPYSGADAATLLVNTASLLLDQFRYQCVASNACSTTSNNATLTVHAANGWRGTTADWDTPSNWFCGLPTASTDVSIPDAPSGGNFPLISSAGTAVCRNLNISPLATLTLANASSLSIHGNMNNDGSFVSNQSTVIFTGAGNAVISGLQPLSFHILRMDKNNGSDTLNVSGINITITQTGVTNSLNLVRGMFRLAGGSTVNKTSAGGIEIQNAAGIIVDGGTLNLSGNYSLTNSGYFRLISGNVAIGSGSGNSFNANAGSVTVINGGNMEIASRFSSTAAASFNITGGNIELSKVANTSGTIGSFNMNPTTSLSMSGGMVSFRNPAAYRDINIVSGSGSKSITGGSFRFGNALTPAGAVFNIGNTATDFYSLHLNQCAAVNLNTAIGVKGQLQFTKGVLISSPVNMISFGQGATAVGDTTYAFINGPAAKSGDGAFFRFPIGFASASDTVWAPAALDAFAPGDLFTAEYIFAPSPNYNIADSMSSGITGTSPVEYWMISRMAGSSTPAVTLYCKDSARSAISDPALLTVAHKNASIWEDMGGMLSWNPGEASGSVRSTLPFTSYSPITFGFKNNVPLPVTFLSFNARCSNGSNQIDWVTASETNNDYFTLQRSEDLLIWHEIAKIQGAGNSNIMQHYSFTDASPAAALTYYRLIQTDYDGTSAFHGPVAVSCDEELQPQVSLYPNPVENAVNLFISAQKEEIVRISIYDASGKCVAENVINSGAGISLCSIDVSHLPAGIYSASIVFSSQRIHKKFVKN